MKKIQLYLFIGLLTMLSATSCKKFLDVNKNPNDPISATPELMLPQSIVRTASLMVGLNDYGARLMGYEANAGGVSGWGSFVSYNYTTGDFASLFYNGFKANEDLQEVINLSRKDSTHNTFIAAAQILKAFNFQSLVDVYNDIPYTDALKGKGVLQPKYDKAEDIYKALADSLDVSMAILSTNSTSSAFKSSDPLFKGDINQWIRFANTIKLRLILRANGKVQFSNTTFNSLGFLTADAIVNPGYTKIDGKQNPTWSTWAYDAAGTPPTAASQRIPTPYILTYYDGNKVSDAVRVDLVFNKGVAVPTNQLGYQGDDAKKGPTPSAWFVGSDAKNYDNIGILKGPDMGQPIMLASESYFLQAQANLKGIIGSANNVKENFKSGVLNSFKYLEKDNTGAIHSGKNPQADFDAYIAANKNNYLVNIDSASTNNQMLEAIVTQQYIAYNMIMGHQSWFEYLRTGYPKISGDNNAANKLTTFVSTTSESSTSDRLPTRILYPANEYSYNQKNVPTGISAFSSKIFWAK
jgi:hypothetical protein